jgi:hypothetical protein
MQMSITIFSICDHRIKKTNPIHNKELAGQFILATSDLPIPTKVEHPRDLPFQNMPLAFPTNAKITIPDIVL